MFARKFKTITEKKKQFTEVNKTKRMYRMQISLICLYLSYTKFKFKLHLKCTIAIKRQTNKQKKVQENKFEIYG